MDEHRKVADGSSALLQRLAALRRIALAVVRPTGPSEGAFLHGLLAEVTAALPADGALVAVFADAERKTLRTLAARLDGQVLPDFEYAVQGSPCQRVVGPESRPRFRYTARGVLGEVDARSAFAAAQLDAYAAFPLTDSRGTPLGVLAALGRQPIADGDADHAELVLNVAAGRLAGELERRQAMNVLRDTALAVSAARGETIFDELVRMLAASLGVEFAFVARHTRADPDHLTIVSLFSDGRIVNGRRYAIAPTPCSTVLGQQFRAYPSELASRFQEDPDVLGNGAESYAGLPLTGIGGEPLGVIAVGSRRPLGDVAQTEAMLRIFAARAGAELERLAALEALRRSEASYRTIFDSAASAIYVHDWDSFALIDVNRRACEEHGRTREELLAARPEELMGVGEPFDLERALERLQQARLGRCPPFEWQLRIKDGSIRWWEIHLRPAQLDGRPCILAFTHDITARKAAEERLRNSEAQYRSIFDASADALMLWDSRLRRVDANPANERLFGFRREESIGGGLEELPYPQEYIRPRVEMLRRALAGEASRAELPAVRRDGTQLLIEMRTIPFEHRGEPHALQIVRDITERKLAEQQLRASEEQHRTIFNASVDGMLVKDAGNVVVDVNEAYLRMHGFAREELVGSCLLDFLPPALRAQCQLLLPGVMAGTPCHFEAQTLRRDGSLLDVEIHGVRVVYGGQARALVVMRDITERKRAEAHLRASEAQYRAMFDVSDDALMLWDHRLRRVDVNRAHQRVFGYEREEVVGRAFEGLDWPEDLVQQRIGMLQRALAGEASRAEVEAVRKDGRRIVTELRTIPFVHHGEPHVLQIARDITDRLAADARLRQSEEQYRSIFNASEDALTIWDRNYRRVDVNTAHERRFGYRRDEVVGRGFELFSDDERYQEERRALIRRALAEGGVRVELEGRTRDGTPIVTEDRLVPFQHQGEPHVLSISRDITEQRRREHELRDSEAQYRAIFNSSADAIVLWDPELRFVDVNRAYTQMYGFEREEVIGTTLDRRLSPAAVATREAMMRAALAGEERVHETTTLRKNGESFDVELRYFPIVHQGKPHVLAIARDISDRKKAEAALRAREQLHRALFDTSTDAMVLFDKTKRLVDVNPAFASIRGVAREDLVGRPWPRRAVIPGKETVQPLVESALAGQEATTITNVLHQTEGKRIDMELRYLPVRLDGEPFALGIGRIVTERLQLEAQLRQAQKMEAIGQLTGGIAHDFNNILTSVLGYVSMAEERAESGADERLLRQLGQARLATERARDLVAQMLAFAQRRGGRRQRLSPARLVRESIDLLRPTMPASVLLETEGLDAPLPDIDGDAVQLSQVLMNLVINARDAVEGRGRVRLSLGTRASEPGGATRLRCRSCGETLPAGRWLAVSVEDNGSGIPPDVLARMFDPFFSTKPAGRGTGMGLAMVHGIVHNHGGHIDVLTRPDEGSNFSVLLPLPSGEQQLPAARQAETVAGRHPRSAEGAADPAAPPAALSGRVLLVEDDGQAGEFLRERLTNWGLQVTLHRDPREALAWLSSGDAEVDLLITDLTMPHLSGLELASQVTLLRPGLPVLLMSGDLRTADAAARRAAGVGFTLAKPPDAAALRDVVERALAPVH